ncbi:hypothetical protein SAMN05880593_1529 [Rhizobium sp. RU36D]|nr:hypothetical protein SAMN05880593_1529 [Rhizobium sp. RU36D]
MRPRSAGLPRSRGLADERQGRDRMNLRAITVAGLCLALAACTTTGTSGNGVEARWNGQQAGAFFAKFGPPTSDSTDGNDTLYSWRGGYKTRTIPAVYETLSDGKRGKLKTPARREYASCSVQLRVSQDYVIRSVRIVSDRPGINGGKTYCEEFLGES